MADAIQQLTASVQLVIPEIILLGTVCMMFVIGPFLVSETGQARAGLRRQWSFVALAALAAAALVWARGADDVVTSGPFRVDGLVWLVRALTFGLGAALVTILSDQIDDGHAAEANACLLAILAGVNFAALANDLVTLFLALELVSIPTYVLLYLPRRGPGNQEATIKYMLLSVFSSALVLYGMALLYGAAGTTNLGAMTDALVSGDRLADKNLLLPAIGLLIAGLSFRLAAVPFHFYAPDVFQGVTTSAAAMLSIVPKVVGVVALVRLLPLTGAFAEIEPGLAETPVRLLLGVLAVATMFLGNLLALRQQHLLRLVAYSSIAHAGYMLVGLAAGIDGTPVSGVGALAFYLAAYGITTLALFCLLIGACSPEPPRMISDIAGLSRFHPVAALLSAVCLFSLTGLPPTAGFTGKLNLFFASWSEGTTLGRVLACSLALNAAISAWYYLRLIGVMYLDEPVGSLNRRPAAMAPTLAGAVLAAATVALFVAPQPLWDAAVRCIP